MPVFLYQLSVSDLARSNRKGSSVSLGMSVESIPLPPLPPPLLLGQREKRVGGDRHVGELSFPAESRESQIYGLQERQGEGKYKHQHIATPISYNGDKPCTRRDAER